MKRVRLRHRGIQPKSELDEGTNLISRQHHHGQAMALRKTQTVIDNKTIDASATPVADHKSR